MSIVDSLKAWPKAKKITVAVIAAVAVAAVGVTIFLINRNNILATTMRLLKVEGTVNIEDASGTVKPVIDNIRFTSGDTLSTGSDGLASIGLDDTKIVTLQNDSSAQFIKNGKQIELKLKQGGVFFEVTEKLTEDETYEIETSNMTVGIRGTSGYVWYDETGLQSLVITDGKVLVSGYNPETGETKTVEVCGGQMVSCYLYSDKTEERDSIEFALKDVSEEELPQFPLQMLAENDKLLEKVCAETGWDKDKLLNLVNAILDPNTPSPTPDEIIEITDTPTATPKATNTPSLTPTVSPSPTSSPTPTKKPTSTPTATPASTEAPIPTVAPETTPTGVPTVTPSNTPMATPTAKPSTPTPTATPTTKPSTPTPTDTPTPPPTPTPEPEPEIPDDFSGYAKYEPGWNKTYDGHKVYIIRYYDDVDYYYIYYGYTDSGWYELDPDYESGGYGVTKFYISEDSDDYPNGLYFIYESEPGETIG
ncbi:MAG: FecR domain-containing protein [Clostridiales bacterium]|nr:FecR domain-containing protein [Clostridiales bacterium]